jgi:hypothetical protein
MVASIVATYKVASPEQVASGHDWYPLAGRLVEAIASHVDREPDEVAAIIAALSPRNPWRWNVTDAYRYCVAARDGQPMPSATTFKRNSARAWIIAVGINRDPWNGKAPKVRAFIKAILGDMSAVVVDLWAIRVATEGRLDHVNDGNYRHVENAYRDASRRLGVTPREVQAVTWLVAQDAGLASRRRGRNDLSFKRDTPAFIRDALA